MPTPRAYMEPAAARLAEFRREVLTRFLYITCAVSIAVIPAYWLIGLRPLFWLNVVYFALVGGLCYLHNIKRTGRAYCGHVFLGLTLLITLSGIYFGNEIIDNKPWQLLLPILAFLVVGSRPGLWWALASLAALVLTFALRWQAYEPMSVFILLLAHPTVAYAMFVFSSWNEENLRIISRLSHTDPLTKTYNRQLFDELFVNLFNRARRAEEPLAVYMIDIDHFKKFNDHYGHIAGDHALMRVAEVMRGAARRATDLVFRYGGEEFCIVSSGVNSDDALFIAESITAGVRTLGIVHAGSEHAQLTVSIGVAYVGLIGDADTETLLRRADAALYRAKTRGRDRIEIDATTTAPVRPEWVAAAR